MHSSRDSCDIGTFTDLGLVSQKTQSGLRLKVKTFPSDLD